MQPLPIIARHKLSPEFDPVAQPTVDAPALPSLQASTLQLPFIREAFARPIRWQVEPLFRDQIDFDSTGRPEIKPAAVCIPLVERGADLHVLLTRRAANLYKHAGQICFPGGRIESTDRDFVHAALRETWEEVGVEARYVELIGSQPSFLTNSFYTVKPVVGVLRPGYSLRPDQSEVAEVFEVPLSQLLNPTLHRLHQINTGDAPPRYFYSMTWKSYFIWGATAVLIRNLYHFLAAAEAAQHSG